jgi:hypothetical protein
MIIAKCLNNVNPWGGNKYPLEIGKNYEVEDIDMGQSYTTIKLAGIKEPINSVCLEFFIDGAPINIYSDKRFNPYL